MAIADKPTGLSEQVLESVKAGEQAAIEAVRKFVDAVELRLPRLGEPPSWRRQVIDSSREMAERLVQAQHDFLHNIVLLASRWGRRLSRRSEDARPGVGT